LKVAVEVVASESKNFAFIGERLYPPSLLAAYTILINVPLGLILYGMNIMARGNRLYGKIMIGSGVLGGIWLLAFVLSPHRGRTNMFLLTGLICGLSIYKSESGPYQRAIAAGALKARWWPPLLFSIGIMTAIYLYEWFIVRQ
jgi:hypothetical protein